MKLFISQPMNGKTDAEIHCERSRIIGEVVENHLPEGEALEIVDSFFTEGYKHPLMYLGKGIEKMAGADTAYFAKGWETARGCKCENMIAKAYGLTVIEE
jgi:hypothetical protein